jgi:Nuclease-related domain
VTPAPDAEPNPGSGQNVGVSGATRAAAPDAGQAGPGANGTGTGNAAAGNQGRRPRLLAPIRYAHSSADPTPPRAAPSDTGPAQAIPTQPRPAQAVPTQPVPTQPVPTQPVPTQARPTQAGPAQAGSDQTAGLVYEASSRADAERPSYPEHHEYPEQREYPEHHEYPERQEHHEYPERQEYPEHHEYPDRPAYAQQPAGYPEYADTTEPAEPADDGLAILGGMATTEVPDDEDAPSSGRAQSPTGYEPSSPPPPAEPPTANTRLVGASWNQPITSAPQPVDGGMTSRPRPFGRRGGSRGVRTWRRGPAPGPGGSKAAIRDLPPDVQMRFWRLRVTIMIIVGLAFGLLTRSWVIGLTLAIIAGIIDTVFRARNAASYANGAPQGGAQRRTRRQLAKMRRAGYFALDGRRIPNSPEVIDHLVIGPTGVYAIDSEKWNPKLPIRTWNGKKLYHGPDSQKPRLEHAVWEAGQASEILSSTLGSEIVVRPALAIYGPKIPWDIAEIRGVDVFSGPALRKYLKRRARSRDGVPKLTREQVRTIYDTASRLLPDLSQTPAPTPVG